MNDLLAAVQLWVKVCVNSPKEVDECWVAKKSHIERLRCELQVLEADEACVKSKAELVRLSRVGVMKRSDESMEIVQ